MRLSRNILAVLLFSVVVLSGCGGSPFWLPKAHKIDIQQGNLISDEHVAAVKSGLSRAQIVQLLGAPVMQNLFDEDRWDYVYSKGVAGEPEKVMSLVIYFKEDIVARIDNNYKP